MGNELWVVSLHFARSIRTSTAWVNEGSKVTEIVPWYPTSRENPGFPVELGCSIKLPAAFLKRKPHPCVHNGRRVVGNSGPQRDAPNFLHAALDKAASAPFFKERRMRCTEPTKFHRKSGVWGTRGWWLGQIFRGRDFCRRLRSCRVRLARPGPALRG